MALCHNCDEARIPYIGNGSQVLYDFPFEYNERGDIAVAFWNEEFILWQKQPGDIWTFENDTTIRFLEAPADNQIFIIYRCTDLTELAEFYPGTSIKAKDLNDNFFMLEKAIEEVRCEAHRGDNEANEKFWNKIPYKEVSVGTDPDVGETIYTTDRWVCTDEAIASTGAICDKIEEEIDILKVTKRDQQLGRWIQDLSDLDDDEHFATTAAITERLDPYFQDKKPLGSQPYEIPGKHWFNNDNVTSRYWDQENRVWVMDGIGGPPGPIGPTGSYSTIVSDTAPTRRLDNTPLKSGDVWFNSTTAELFIWYDDGQPPNSSRSQQWVQAVGGAGAQGPPGPEGKGAYNFIEPIAQSGDDVSFDINLLATLP